MVGRGHAASADPSPEKSGPRGREPLTPVPRAGLDAGQHIQGFPRHAYRVQAVAFADVEHLGADGRVQMKVMVGIDMVQRQTGRSIGAELGLDFRCELPAHARPEEDGDARHRQVAA